MRNAFIPVHMHLFHSTLLYEYYERENLNSMGFKRQHVAFMGIF
jgi:hypothetical protein